MSRFLLYGGIVLTVIGVIGFVAGMIIFPMQIANTVSSATHPDTSNLCHSDETLSTEEGPEEYDVSQQIYDHSVYFYCTNKAGVQRDVTDQVGQGIVNTVFSSFGGSLTSVLIPVLSSILCIPGIIMIIIGAIFSPRRVMRAAMVSRYRGDGWATPPVTPQPSQPQPPIDSDLAGRLRQLEEARQSGLLTEDEYQQKRRQILGSMQ
ncbi:MAG TPA: SHOCT domain-containing protein [Phototrophicaceae bacterium]|nr:SHOCT domain-containing protein [Phototrophicaceae bacterium]